jgi:large subunit ribosomal protein L21e
MASKKAKGKRSKTRRLMKRGMKPKLSINKLTEPYEVGQKVIVNIDSSFHSTLPDKRFQGKPGIVKGTQGRHFSVEVKKGNMIKKLVLASAHMAKSKN